MFPKFRNIALKILALDDTQLPEEQFEFIFDCIQRVPKFKNNIKDKKEFLDMLKKKHSINGIIVSNGNGSVLLCDKISKKKTLDKMKELLSNNESLLVKKKSGWDIYLVRNGNFYLVSANSDLTQTELKAIAKDVEEFLNRNLQIQ